MPPPQPSDDPALLPDQEACRTAIRAVLAPLARLALSRGLSFAAVQEDLKAGFVEAARATLAASGLPEHRLVSRISTATGINRREVTRLTQDAARPSSGAGRSAAAEVFTRWLADADYRDAAGQPLALPRQGGSPSFETLARSVTQDVHPRSLLDELCRLGLAAFDPPTDLVRVCRQAFVPSGDLPRLLALLADNVGDHLQAAVANVTGADPQHVEQAVYADELSLAALPAVQDLARSEWRRLLERAVPLLEGLIAADREAGRPQDQRVRIGLYAYHEPMAGPPPLPAPPTSRARRLIRTRSTDPDRTDPDLPSKPA